MIHLSQPSIIILVFGQTSIGRNYLPRFIETGKVAAKVCLHTIIFQALLSSSKPLPSTNSSINAREELNTLLHECRYKTFDFIDILNNGLNCLFIKSKTLCNILKYTNKINNQSTFLILIVGTIGSANSLQQSMILHWFVQIHTLEYRCVKTC